MPTAKSPGTLSSDTFRKFAAQSIFVDNCFNGGPGRLLKESLRWRQLGQGAIRDHGKSLHVKPLLLSSWRRTKQCQPQDYPKAMLSLCNGIWTILPPIPLCKAFFYILKYKLLSCMILFGRKFALCLFSHFRRTDFTRKLRLNSIWGAEVSAYKRANFFPSFQASNIPWKLQNLFLT